jgi:hypothetical protein
MTARVLKVLAWMVIVGGVLINPIAQGLMVLHSLSQPRFEAQMVPMELYEMLFGTIGAVVCGASLLILLDIQHRIRADQDLAKRF